ncbi:hypothetical protein D3C78_1513340 [compost metagenome]
MAAAASHSSLLAAPGRDTVAAQLAPMWRRKVSLISGFFGCGRIDSSSGTPISTEKITVVAHSEAYMPSLVLRAIEPMAISARPMASEAMPRVPGRNRLSKVARAAS